MAFRLPMSSKGATSATRCSENGCLFGTYGVTSHLLECYTRDVTCEVDRLIQRRVAREARRRQRAAMRMRERVLHRAEMRRTDSTWTPGRPEPVKPSRYNRLLFQYDSNPLFVMQRRRGLELSRKRRLLPFLLSNKSADTSFFHPVSKGPTNSVFSVLIQPGARLYSNASPIGLGSRLAHFRDVSRQR